MGQAAGQRLRGIIPSGLMEAARWTSWGGGVIEVAKVGKEKLQLIGATALLIASKYEENYPPEIAEICYFSGATIGNFRRVLNIYRWRGFGGLITRGRVVDAWQPWLQLGTPLASAVPALGTLC